MAASSLIFTEAEVRALLQRDEGQFLEFKSLWDRSGGTRRQLGRREARNFVGEHVAAFANADGGTLVLGVDDDGPVSGHGYPDDAVELLLEVPENRLRPPVGCRVQRITIDGHEILIFQVPIAPEAVMFEGNGFPCRVGDQVIRETQEAINERKQTYRRVGYEQRVHPDATLDDIDADLAKQFLARSVYRERKVEEALEELGLVAPASVGARITNACLLLFGRGPFARWHPRAGIRFFRVADAERRHGTDRNVTQIRRIEPPLAKAILDAHRVGREQIRRSEKLHDLFFREMPEYPEFAWQEALVNAFAHRDYEDRGREIEVWFYEDRMEVRSPGDLVPPVTLERLRLRRPVHASRNPLLVRVLVEVGLMREEGEGIPRMFEEMETSFLKAPEFGTGEGEFAVMLRNEPIFTGPAPEWQTLVQRLPMRTAQKRVLLAHPDGFANEDYRRLNSVDRDEAYKQIQEMVQKGLITPAEGSGRGAVYRVASDLHEARAFLEPRLGSLREFFARQERLKNADYRKLFDVTRMTAWKELRRLVEEDFLRMEGERRGTYYVAGRDFPRIEERDEE